MTRRRALWVLGIAAWLVGGVLVALDLRMWDEGGPGIVGFELAWTNDRVAEILEEWGDPGRDAARLSLWLDFAYLALYGAFWALAAAASRDIARRQGWARLARLGPVAVWLAPLAAVYDALEDVFLLIALGRPGAEVAPLLGALFACMKFAALGAVVAYVAVVVARRLYTLAPRLVVATVAGGAALLVLLLAVNTWTVERETQPAHADVGRILRLPQGDIQVREDGDPSKPPVVLIHGFACSLRWWDDVVPALARDLHVVRVDLLGHGGSEKPRDGYSMENQADIVATVMGRLGIGRAAVVGHSLGGAVVTALAERHPGVVDRLMVIGTVPDRGSEHVPLRYRAAFWPVVGHAIDRLAGDRAVRAELEQGADPLFDFPDRLVHDIKGRTTYSSFKGSAERLWDYWGERSVPDRLAATGVAVTAMFGSREPRARESIGKYNAIPSGRTVLLEGLDHTPQVEAPGRTARLIAAFALS